MAVPILVVAGHDLGQGGLDVGQVAFLLRQGRGVLHQVEHGPGVAVGRRRKEIKDLVAEYEQKIIDGTIVPPAELEEEQ